ncbi:semaphorin-1A-like [Patiria miniata]|uniref:Ig-like domain-containing protein n=1 Tax=Patiria miniata TaxID=46514 RepID=A0A914BMD0_PATMI|nr:semaphorin-1A-like [Patiria miniata]
MTRTRLLLRSRSAVLLTALHMIVFLGEYQHAAAVKLYRTSNCWEILDSSVLDATSDTSAPSGQPAYRILNKIDENVYIGGNETLRRRFLVNNQLEMEEIQLGTMEPEGLVLTCEAVSPTTKETVCWNFIRIADKTSSGDLLVCGTNAFSRQCYQCPQSNLNMCTELSTNYTQLTVVPQQNNINAETAIFSSNAADVDTLFGGSDRKQTFNRYSVDADLSTADPIEFELDTVTVGEGFIKDPTFIGRPFEYTHDDGNEYVYLIYRETALEFTLGTKVYSRIARVCKNDTGGTVNDMKFVTFIKARLECSVPNGDEPAFEYDYIQDVVWDANNTRVYAVFTNQENGPATSALCQYRMGDIMNLFDNGNFQEQDEGNVNVLWNEVLVQRNPRPGTCGAIHKTDYPPLLHKSVPSYNAMERTGGTQDAPPANFPKSDPPILNVDDVRFTSLAVDLQYSSPVYFVGTSAGSVIKFTSGVCDGINTTNVVEVSGLNANGPINGLELLRSADSAATFLVGTSDFQASIEWPLNTKCQSARNGEQCALRYPYCYFTNESECTSTKVSVPQDPPTELPEDVLTVLPNANVSACLNDHVYWFCHLDIDNPAIGSTSFTLQWDITESEEIKMTPISTNQLVRLDVIVQSGTVGSYSCTANVGGRVVTKQVELSMKTDCLTRDNLCARMEEYNTLKSQNEALHEMYGNGNEMCSVKRQDCATVDLTCPTSP